MEAIIFYAIGILQYLIYAYLIAWAIYMIVKLRHSEDTLKLLCSPVFGVFKVDMKKGIAIICIQTFLLGSLCLSILQYIHEGSNFMLLPLPNLN